MARQWRGDCQNCDNKGVLLARVCLQSPSGGKLHLMVCRFCYLQLNRDRARRSA